MLFTMTPLLAPSVVVEHTEDADSPTTSTLPRKSMLESNPSSSSSSEPKTQRSQEEKVKKSVNFNTKVRVRKISTHRRYSVEERANTWFSSQEFKDIRKSAITTVKKMMKKIPVDEEPDDCSRGLECKTPKKNKLRQARKSDILWTVLSELTNCHETGRNPELAAQIYTSCSRICYEEAAKRGAMDAVEAWSKYATTS
jgi:hypothetical protein